MGGRQCTGTLIYSPLTCLLSLKGTPEEFQLWLLMLLFLFFFLVVANPICVQCMCILLSSAYLPTQCGRYISLFGACDPIGGTKAGHNNFITNSIGAKIRAFIIKFPTQINEILKGIAIFLYLVLK